jgi:small-conductance mechanosensitive channel
MSRFDPRNSAPSQAARPSAVEAKAENERYATFRARLKRIADAAAQAGQEDLADRLVDLGQQVEDRELTLEEGAAELRAHEAEIRAMLKR